ncbi:hypothetical protein N0V85_009379 [Neurospora sp. IMI 360204]|nr:hypothetical protein N0V85_009379 [Neurospora sp. IMI 360204]
MPNGITPEEERRRQEQEHRYQKAEEKARAAWQRGLENEREAAEVLKEEKKTHAGKRRVSFDSSRNQTHLLYSVPSTIDSTPAESTDVGEPSDELLSERYQLLVKEIASLRAEFAEFEAIKVKQAEAEALARKKQEHEAAWKEQERHRQKAEEEALKVKEADESVLARIRQEGEAARRKWHEAWDEKKHLRQVAEEEALKAKEAEEKALTRVKQEYEARKEQERRRQMEKGEIARKRGLENERPSTSQAYPRKPEQGTYPPEPSSQQHPPTKQYPPIDHSHLKHLKHGHPSPRQTPSPSSVPVGLSGLPAGSLCSGPSASPVPIGLSGLHAESLCSDEAQEVARYKDQGQYRSGHTTTYGSKQQELAQQGHHLSAPRLTWSTPSVPAWNVPTPEPQVTKQTLVIPVVRSYHAGVQTPKEQWPLPPTPGHSEKEPEVPTPAESEKKKLERQKDEAARWD